MPAISQLTESLAARDVPAFMDFSQLNARAYEANVAMAERAQSEGIPVIFLAGPGNKPTARSLAEEDSWINAILESRDVATKPSTETPVIKDGSKTTEPKTKDNTTTIPKTQSQSSKLAAAKGDEVSSTENASGGVGTHATRPKTAEHASKGEKSSAYAPAKAHRGRRPEFYTFNPETGELRPYHGTPGRASLRHKPASATSDKSVPVGKGTGTAAHTFDNSEAAGTTKGSKFATEEKTGPRTKAAGTEDAEKASTVKPSSLTPATAAHGTAATSLSTGEKPVTKDETVSKQPGHNTGTGKTTAAGTHPVQARSEFEEAEELVARHEKHKHGDKKHKHGHKKHGHKKHGHKKHGHKKHEGEMVQARDEESANAIFAARSLAEENEAEDNTALFIRSLLEDYGLGDALAARGTDEEDEDLFLSRRSWEEDQDEGANVFVRSLADAEDEDALFEARALDDEEQLGDAALFVRSLDDENVLELLSRDFDDLV
ncbi:hypothetical protein OC842_007044 [Tilletia horrida]|uniref:Uncharacterized protein n=1 Tax=Tilletia horrida TaxID=155126 RepID=A0AAN6G4F1_9BASI|nr:hypothetical protein OC842_007044 [Tilletia horrida]